MSNVVVKFNDVRAFIAELEQIVSVEGDGLSIHRKTVRVTNRFETTLGGLAETSVSAIASFAVQLPNGQAEIISLDYRCGSYSEGFGPDAKKKVLEKAEGVHVRLTEAIKRLGLRKAAGAYQIK